MGPWLKLIHILAAIAWLGPIFGAWWVYLAARRSGRPELTKWVTERMHDVLMIEHVGLAVLLGTGLAQLFYYRYWPPAGSWLWFKLWLVGLVVVPVEIADIWLSHRVLRGALARQEAGSTALEQALARHDRWMWYGGTLIMAAALAIVSLAVLKPRL